MTPLDLLALALGALRGHRMRTRMTAAAIAIGIAAVLVLTALGQGVRDWVADRFAALGSNTLVVLPGRTETRGGPPLAIATTRDLTLDDAVAIRRRVPGVREVVPVVVGEATAEHGGRRRATTVVGSTTAFLTIRRLAPALGTGLPDGDIERGARVCVIGHAVRRELFGERNPLGEKVRLGDHPFRVVGVIGPCGYSMMVDVDELVLVPVASAMKIFNQTGLFRIIVQTTSADALAGVEARVAAALRERHDGEEDFTLLTPGAVAATLDSVIRLITNALAAIAAVSLAVGGISVMNVMVVSVAERTAEIGLLKAVGASDAQVLAVFLAEAVALTVSGGALGIAGGLALTAVARALYPAIPFHVPGWSLALGAGTAVAVGLVFGVLPAARAARLEPLDALREALMALGDLLRLVLASLGTQRLRAALTMLGIVVGVAAVVLLGSIGEGVREGIAAQFSQFGTTVVGVHPGRTTTFGAGPAALGTTRPLTVEDGEALRRVPGVRYVAPHVVGLGEVEAGERRRRCNIYGTVSDDQHCLKWYPRMGGFLPEGDADAIPAVCVLGPTVARELFPDRSPLGARVRVGEARFTVVGVMQAKGQMLGFDLDDMVFIPVRRAMRLFNREGVAEIHVYVASHAAMDGATAGVRRVLTDRHDGEEDFTIAGQADMLATIGEVMDVLTAGVLVIAGISLVVGAMGILTILWVSVHDRTAEIGLAKAIGASDGQVLLLFLAEAAALALAGGVAGLAAGAGGGFVLEMLVPGLRVSAPPWLVPAALGASLATGIVAGVLPAVRAARLDPIEALRAE